MSSILSEAESRGEGGRTVEESSERGEAGDRGGDCLSFRVHGSHLGFLQTDGSAREKDRERWRGECELIGGANEADGGIAVKRDRVNRLGQRSALVASGRPVRDGDSPSWRGERSEVTWKERRRAEFEKTKDRKSWPR